MHNKLQHYTSDSERDKPVQIHAESGQNSKQLTVHQLHTIVHLYLLLSQTSCRSSLLNPGLAYMGRRHHATISVFF